MLGQTEGVVLEVNWERERERVELELFLRAGNFNVLRQKEGRSVQNAPPSRVSVLNGGLGMSPFWTDGGKLDDCDFVSTLNNRTPQNVSIETKNEPVSGIELSSSIVTMLRRFSRDMLNACR